MLDEHQKLWRDSAPEAELERFSVKPGARVFLRCKAGAESAKFSSDDVAFCQLVKELNGSGHCIMAEECICHLPQPSPARYGRAVIGQKQAHISQL
jgi:hypothetical protein